MISSTQTVPVAFRDFTARHHAKLNPIGSYSHSAYQKPHDDLLRVCSGRVGQETFSLCGASKRMANIMDPSPTYSVTRKGGQGGNCGVSLIGEITRHQQRQSRKKIEGSVEWALVCTVSAAIQWYSIGRDVYSGLWFVHAGGFSHVLVVGSCGKGIREAEMQLFVLGWADATNSG